jgi:Tol biopolymer transport system component
MGSSLRRYSALSTSGTLILTVLALGCGQPVREDRSINWSSQGDAVGFQHGKEGVFLADKEGKKLTKIFEPGPDVIATSTPLWSPTGKRVIFTTARAVQGQPSVNLPFAGREQDPAGNIYHQQDILYTCWLHEPENDDKTTLPAPLFEAACDHTGYVAANLAVRWRPKVESIYYIKEVSAHEHGLFAFDLSAKESHQVFPHTSAAMIFDWTPDGAHLVCVLGGQERRKSDGIWIGEPDQGGWWHVPQSGAPAESELSSALERLRASRPAWTPDGSRFAFPSYTLGKTKDQPGRHSVHRGTLASREIEVWGEGDKPFRDLQWDRSGTRLGVVRSTEDGSLHLVRRGEALSPAVNRQVVRHFVGWNAAGDQLAYTVPDKLPLDDGELWALLLVPDEAARDAVYLAPGAGTEPGRQVFSGMRVTFPQWSPREDKLSLWVTFTPAYRSWVSQMLGWGLRPGDPAAVFDIQSGQLHWMAVNPQEKVQVGHYYLLKKDYAEAWRWYEQAERELPPRKQAAGRQFLDQLQSFQGPRDFRIFEYYCLKKLGRQAEAQVKLEQFQKEFLPSSGKKDRPAGQENADQAFDTWFRELLDSNALFAPLLQDLYVAEVFLSLDAAPDGEAFFRDSLASAKTDASRLSHALALGQILLLEKKYEAYADLATQRIGPLLLAFLKPAPPGGPQTLADALPFVEVIGLFSLLPLADAEFVRKLPNPQLQAIAKAWRDLQARGVTDSYLHLADLVLHAAYGQLGQEKERQEVAERLKRHPAAMLVMP